MSFYRFVRNCFLAAFFFSCSTENQTDSEEALIVVDKMVRSYVITPKVFDGKNSLQYEIVYTFNYDKKGRILFVDGNHYLNVPNNWYRKYTRTTYTYDEVGNIVGLVCIDSQNGKTLNELSLEYNKLGLLIKSIDKVSNEVLNYEYNTKNEVVSIKRKVNDTWFVLRLEYNIAGNLSRVYDPNREKEEKDKRSEVRYSEENLNFLYANLSYGVQLVPWIDTKSAVNFLNCDGLTWTIENQYSTDDMLPSSHVVRYQEDDATFVHFYTLDYKKVHMKK